VAFLFCFASETRFIMKPIKEDILTEPTPIHIRIGAALLMGALTLLMAFSTVMHAWLTKLFAKALVIIIRDK
jgi:hypothetical protein